jgi:hypothetical protein
MLLDLLESDPSVYDLITTHRGPAGKLPLDADLLRHARAAISSAGPRTSTSRSASANVNSKQRLIEGETMSPSSYHGVVRGGVVLLDEGVPLADGTEVNVSPVQHPVPNGPLIVAALAAGPKVPGEWVDELERLIEEGQRQPMREELFPERGDDAEGR